MLHRARIAALLSTLAIVPACGHADATATTSPAATSASEPAELLWAAWTPETFAKAQQDNRIILINVVATWCHWCHVMEETTYTDPEVVALLSAHFVTIRIDSDARPDLAERYREWGWPATALLTPDAQQVTALRGYRNPTKFKALLQGLIADRDAGTLSVRPSPDVPRRTDAELDEIRHRVTAQLDGFYEPQRGGWGRIQKYPFAAPVEHALLRARIHGQGTWQDQALRTLDGERNLVDPVWGGMYQYSLGGVWTKPHYEKITAIQAGAIETYAMAYRVTGDVTLLEPARKVADYMLEMMRSPQGGFFTSQDADLRVEGRPSTSGHDYYALAQDQRRALGMPRIDEQIYADLNGLMIHALTEFYAATADRQILAAAIKAAEHLVTTHRTEQGAFAHHAQDDPTSLLYLRDQAAMGRAFVSLYRVTGDKQWLRYAQQLADTILTQFEDSEHGGFFAHTEDPTAVGVFAERRKPVEENGLTARFLVELHRYLDGDGSQATPYGPAAERAIKALGHQDIMTPEGRIVGLFLLAAEALAMPTVDVTIVGSISDPQVKMLHREALRWFEPRAVVELSHPGERYPDLGKAAVYLCTATACSSPITRPERFAAQADAFIADSLPVGTKPGA